MLKINIIFAKKFQLCTLIWHLTVGNRVLCSAHRLTERNIWVKFNENRPKGSGDMERKQKSYGRNDRLMDGRTDRRRAFPITTLPLRVRGWTKYIYLYFPQQSQWNGKQQHRSCLVSTSTPGYIVELIYQSHGLLSPRLDLGSLKKQNCNVNKTLISSINKLLSLVQRPINICYLRTLADERSRW